MTTADMVTIGLVGAVTLGLLWNALRSVDMRRKPQTYLHLRLGVDDFMITQQDPDGHWLVLGGGALIGTVGIGDVIYIEQLTGPRYVGRVTSVAQVGNHHGVRIERIAG